MVRIHSHLLFALAVVACGGDAEDPGADGESVPDLSGDAIAEYTRTLSDDAFRGRGPGDVGGRMAAEYIAAHFERIGLSAPGGSYLQPFPIVGATPDPAAVSLSFEGPGGEVVPSYLDDFVLSGGDPGATTASGTAELVFVGYGIDAPEIRWNDFEGVDVSGKYLLVLVNDPPAPASDPDRFGGVAMTYYGRWTYKYEEAARRGALGVLVVHETEPAGYPWSVVRGGFSGEQFALPPGPGAASPAALEGWVSTDLARRVLELGGFDLDQLKSRAATRGFGAVETGITVRGSVRSSVRRVDTQNVVGLLRGSARPDEYVTVTAHYDHFGIGEPIDGDSIYNGAYDNASGVALMMSMAESLASMGTAPARSIVFIATGAEEQGLLGAEWYVQAPLFPLDHTVTEVNVDGANLWGLTTDIVALGEARSEVGAFIRSAASEVGMAVLPDPDPEVGLFFRSDHFPFARAGVPAVFFRHGTRYVGRPEGWGDQIQAEYTATHYHAPSDEFSEDFVFDGAVQQGRLALAAVLALAQDDGWPNWHEGQEFRAARDAMMEGR